MQIKVTYEDVNPSIINNTVMKKCFLDGAFKVYTIAPTDGYVLHDNTYDYIDLEGNSVVGYRRSTGTCVANYDFVANSRDFYAVLESEIPADQIFSDSDGGHEAM